MPSFTWVADFDSSKDKAPKVTVVQYGDGYEGRQANGMNNNPGKWSLTFSNRDTTEVDAIEAFLDARGALEAFDWTGLRGNESLRVVCRTWNRAPNFANIDTLTATFDEVFEP